MDTNQQLYEEIESRAAETRQQELELEELRARETEKIVEYENSLTEIWEEIRNANQLAAQQTAYQEAQESNNFPLFNGPSLFKYALILLFFAVPNDLIDAIDFSGFGIPISWFVSQLLSAATLFIVWFADSELKRVKSHMARKGAYQKALAKTATRVAAKLIKFAPRNPAVKILAGAVLEMIPVISLLPWSSISVFLAYTNERKTFKEAREIAESEEISPLSETAPEMV